MRLDDLRDEVISAAIAWAEADDDDEETTDRLASTVDRLRRAMRRPRLALVTTCHAPGCLHAADAGTGFCITHALELSLEEAQQGGHDRG